MLGEEAFSQHFNDASIKMECRRRFDPGKKVAMGESLSIVAGFKNTEFIVIDASTNCELLRVHCGGWHSHFC